MRARQIHRAVEKELGQEISWSSIGNCLRRNSTGDGATFERVAEGLYQLKASEER